MEKTFYRHVRCRVGPRSRRENAFCREHILQTCAVVPVAMRQAVGNHCRFLWLGGGPRRVDLEHGCPATGTLMDGLVRGIIIGSW